MDVKINPTNLRVAINAARMLYTHALLPLGRIIVRNQEERLKVLREIKRDQRRIEAKVDELIADRRGKQRNNCTNSTILKSAGSAR